MSCAVSTGRPFRGRELLKDLSPMDVDPIKACPAKAAANPNKATLWWTHYKHLQRRRYRAPAPASLAKPARVALEPRAISTPPTLAEELRPLPRAARMGLLLQRATDARQDADAERRDLEALLEALGLPLDTSRDAACSCARLILADALAWRRVEGMHHV